MGSNKSSGKCYKISMGQKDYLGQTRGQSIQHTVESLHQHKRKVLKKRG